MLWCLLGDSDRYNVRLKFKDVREKHGAHSSLWAEQVGWVLFAIAIGLFFVSFFEWLYDVYLKSVLSFSFNIWLSDWNMVRAIWVSEVPLVFLLR